MLKQEITYLHPNQSTENNFTSFGFDERFEINRRNALVDKLGYTGLEISRYEHDRLVASYQREFIDDSPVSKANVYWHDGSSMFTFPSSDNLFKMNINPLERDGMTLKGWERLQNVVSQSLDSIRSSGKKDEVVVWYSPMGKAGSRPPFDSINFESGRMYVSVVRPDGFVINFDCKIHEKTFNILNVLNALSLKTGRNQPSNDTFDYLINPFSTQMTSQEFLTFLNVNFDQDEIAYTSLIHSDAKTVPFSSITHSIESELYDRYTEDEIVSMQRLLVKLKNGYDPINDKSIQAMSDTWSMASWDPGQDYLALIHNAAEKNEGKIFLYGCAAVKVVDDPLGIKTLPMGTSIFDTDHRTSMLTQENNLIKNRKEDYHYDYKPGECIQCGHHREKVGPCKICIDCEGKLFQGNFSIN